MTEESHKEVGPALEPCPFCGVTPVRRDNVYRYGSIAEHPDGKHCPIENTTIGISAWNMRADSAGAMVDNASLKKLARRLIDAVINSPCVVEVRMFSQPEAVENLEDEIVKLMTAAAPPAPKEEEAQYVVIDGERRQVVPCPDGRPNCEVLHTTPAPLVLDCDPDD